MNPYYFNSIGLVCDILGVLLLFKFGLPSEVTKNGEVEYVGGNPEEAEVKKWYKYKRWANIALSLLILGFAFQFYANCLFSHGPTSTYSNEKSEKKE